MKPLCYDYLNCPTTFSTYDDFNKKFRITRPESFNFAYDVADRIAQEEPDRLAVLWTDETGACIRYTFGQLKEESDRAANLFKSLGIRKGDKVMLILRRHLEFWPILMALHKLGAVGVPATHLLPRGRGAHPDDGHLPQGRRRAQKRGSRHAKVRKPQARDDSARPARGLPQL